MRCPRTFKKQKGNFPSSQSTIYRANGYYLTICNHCINDLFEHYTTVLGSEDAAIRRICQKFDIYYNQSMVDASHKINAERSRMLAYINKANLVQFQNKTYDDTIDEETTSVISSMDDLEELKEQDGPTVSKNQVKRWGLGFEATEYRQLDEHYRSLSEIIDTGDIVQDTLAKDLCQIKIQQMRAMNRGDADSFQKFTKLYQDTLKTANLKVKSGELSSLTDDAACWGNFIRDVEKYCPADIYKDKKIFHDVDGIADYMNRLVLRPIRNFFGGTNDMDPEFSISVGDEDE